MTWRQRTICANTQLVAAAGVELLGCLQDARLLTHLQAKDDGALVVVLPPQPERVVVDVVA